jgi:hypothetical protein
MLTRLTTLSRHPVVPLVALLLANAVFYASLASLMS